MGTTTKIYWVNRFIPSISTSASFARCIKSWFLWPNTLNLVVFALERGKCFNFVLIFLACFGLRWLLCIGPVVVFVVLGLPSPAVLPTFRLPTASRLSYHLRYATAQTTVGTTNKRDRTQTNEHKPTSLQKNTHPLEHTALLLQQT